MGQSKWCISPALAREGRFSQTMASEAPVEQGISIGEEKLGVLRARISATVAKGDLADRAAVILTVPLTNAAREAGATLRKELAEARRAAGDATVARDRIRKELRLADAAALDEGVWRRPDGMSEIERRRQKAAEWGVKTRKAEAAAAKAEARVADLEKQIKGVAEELAARLAPEALARIGAERERLIGQLAAAVSPLLDKLAAVSLAHNLAARGGDVARIVTEALTTGAVQPTAAPHDFRELLILTR